MLANLSPPASPSRLAYVSTSNAINLQFASSAPSFASVFTASVYGTNVYPIDGACPGPTTLYTLPSGSWSGVTATYASSYANGLDCTVVIQSGDGQLYVNVTSFDTEAGADVLWLHDGASASNPVLASLSGTPSTPLLLASTGNYLTLRFVTNGNATGSGFSLQLSSRSRTVPMLSNAGACLGAAGPQVVTVAPVLANNPVLSLNLNVVLSAQYFYRTAAACTASVLLTSGTLVPVTLAVTTLDLAPGDVVQVFDGVSTTAAQLALLSSTNTTSVMARTYTSSLGGLLVVFSSKGPTAGNHVGFTGVAQVGGVVGVIADGVLK